MGFMLQCDRASCYFVYRTMPKSMAHNMEQDEAMPMWYVIYSHSANDTEVVSERANELSMSKELDHRSVRRVYLITYSQADLVKFPMRCSFAGAVLVSFSGVPASIQWWCCSQEEHQSSAGKHYHMAIKFDSWVYRQSWLESCRRNSKYSLGNGMH